MFEVLLQLFGGGGSSSGLGGGGGSNYYIFAFGRQDGKTDFKEFKAKNLDSAKKKAEKFKNKELYKHAKPARDGKAFTKEEVDKAKKKNRFV